MKFRTVTWYSKILALILFIALPFTGFYAGMKFQEATNPPTANTVTDSDKTTSEKTIVENSLITVKTSHSEGFLTYKGTLQLPTPCHEINDETLIVESSPEQVHIRLNIKQLETGTICAQVITNEKFSGKVEASPQAEITVWLDGGKVE